MQELPEKDFNELEEKELRSMESSASVMDHLMQKYEIRDPSLIITWAVKLLYDIDKLEEGGWVLSFFKGNMNEENMKMTYSQEHNPIHILLHELGPTINGIRCLPLPESIDVSQRIK